MTKYRSKSEIVEAVQWFKWGDHPNNHRNFIWGTSVCEICGNHSGRHCWVGERLVCESNWIITSSTGIHVMSDEVFRERYEPVEDTKSNWIEEITLGDDENSVLVKVRTTSGKLVTHQIATRPLLDTIQEHEKNE